MRAYMDTEASAGGFSGVGGFSGGSNTMNLASFGQQYVSFYLLLTCTFIHFVLLISFFMS